jgi:hypothetical protein
MNALSKILVAAIFFFSATPAFAQTKEEPKQTVEACLGEIKVVYNGKEYNLRAGVHFTPSEVQADPDKNGKSMKLVTGLLQHPAWAPKAAEIQKCLDNHGMKKS